VDLTTDALRLATYAAGPTTDALRLAACAVDLTVFYDWLSLLRT